MSSGYKDVPWKMAPIACRRLIEGASDQADRAQREEGSDYEQDASANRHNAELGQQIPGPGLDWIAQSSSLPPLEAPVWVGESGGDSPKITAGCRRKSRQDTTERMRLAADEHMTNIR